LTIGWGGSTGHHADWYHYGSLLERWLLAHPEVKLAVMADTTAQSFIHLPPERYRKVPVGPLDAFFRFLGTLDIGVAPLLPTDFNRCRSDVKFLEYAAHGVAGIYADLECYRDSVIHGQTGFLYKTDQELLQYLDALAGDAELRQRIREQAYAYVTTHRRIADHVGNRLAFYRGLLTQPAQGTNLSDEVAAVAVQEGNYWQLRHGEPEETLAAVQSGPSGPEAVGKLAALVERYPRYLVALQHLGKLCNDQRDQRRALAYLEQAQALVPDSARTECEMGRAHFLLGDHATARRILEQALTANPFYQLGWQYLLRLLDVTAAADGRRWADRAHELHPANLILALARLKIYPPDHKIEILRQYLENYPATFSPEEWPAAAVVLSHAIQELPHGVLATPPGIAFLRQACDIFPGSARLANFLGRLLFLAGEIRESHEQHARALRIRRRALGYAAEFPKDEPMLPYWRYAENIRKWKGAGAS
jgi:tetratricopeptide (TPR) repeat protein